MVHAFIALVTTCQEMESLNALCQIVVTMKGLRKREIVKNVKVMML